jgi:hypothetical protein
VSVRGEYRDADPRLDRVCSEIEAYVSTADEMAATIRRLPIVAYSSGVYSAAVVLWFRIGILTAREDPQVADELAAKIGEIVKPFRSADREREGKMIRGIIAGEPMPEDDA